MLPVDLKAASFDRYPPEARRLAVAHLATLRRLPLSFAPSLLRELIDYDFKFPVEKAAIAQELDELNSLTTAQQAEWFQAFARIAVSPALEGRDWINKPAQFTELLSESLWATRQLDAFRDAATAYADRLRAAAPPQAPPVPRLGVAIIGQGVESTDLQLFRSLRPHGAFFRRIRPENGLELVLEAAAARAKTHPVPYAHWYVDGGAPAGHSSDLQCISYQALAPARAALLRKIAAETATRGVGPEELRTHLAELTPAELGIQMSNDPILDRFQLKLLTEGSGTQIFSTTFAQWTTRELLRRAQPLTLVARFAPRQRQRPMNELLSGGGEKVELDAVGSLVDADMAAYYHWINQQRLSGSERSAFLVWFEGHNQALAVAPAFARGTESGSAASLGELLAWLDV